MDTNKKMGRPVVYSSPRRPRLIQLSDEVWEAIGKVAGEGKRTEYIEQQLRQIPEIQALLSAPEPEIVRKPVIVTRQKPEPEPVSRPAPAPGPAPTANLRQPVYQIYLKHAPGTCPALPEGFSYIDGDKSTGRRPCANQIHRVFAQPIGIEVARRRAGQLLDVTGVTRVWIEDRKGGQKDSWSKEAERWLRDE
jgi:hypothetical protein